MEPPVRPEGEPPETAFTAELAALVGAGRRAEAADASWPASACRRT